MAINIRRPKLVNFSDKHAELFPLAQPAKKYPKELAVFQNIFWKLTHETPLKDDILKLLFFFSPKIRLTENKDISEQKTFTITAKEYSELTGLKPKSCYTALERAVNSLYDHSIKFFHEDTHEIIRTRLISRCGYKDGVFSVSFTHYALYIMSVFNKDNPFTQLKIKDVMPLGGYALKLYPLFIQNEFRNIFEVDLIQLKSALNINIDAYPDFKDFKKRVLKPSVDQINSLTEMNIEYKATKKSGRKATHVEFKVTKKCTIKPEQPEQPEQQKQKIKAIDIYKILSSNDLLPRFLEFGETSEELINRIKDDLKNNNSERWINKLAEFNINIDAP